MLDIRLPIGLLFLAIGGLLAAYGLLSAPSAYRVSLGYDVNLIWGVVMALFGAGMLLWAGLDRQKAAQDAGNPDPRGEEPVVLTNS